MELISCMMVSDEQFINALLRLFIAVRKLMCKFAAFGDSMTWAAMLNVCDKELAEAYLCTTMAALQMRAG